MNILLIEDDEEKMEKILGFINHQYPGATIEVSRSFNAGLRSIIKTSSLDFILLDMSMPNYNATEEDPSGGAPEHFAGRDILSQMKLRGIGTPTIVITMFDLFGENPERMSFSQLEHQLKTMYEPIFLGMVYYNSGQEGWKSSLSSLINKLHKDPQ
jgi:CheY-like chemotaxis protein